MSAILVHLPDDTTLTDDLLEFTVPAGFAATLYPDEGEPLDTWFPPVAETVLGGDGTPVDLKGYATTQDLSAAIANLHNDDLTQQQRISDLVAALAPLQADPTTKTYVDNLLQAVYGIDANLATAIQQLQDLLSKDDGLVQNLLATQAQHTQQLNQHTQTLLAYDSAIQARQRALANRINAYVGSTVDYTLDASYLNQVVTLYFDKSCTIHLPAGALGDTIYLAAAVDASKVGLVATIQFGSTVLGTLRQDVSGTQFLHVAYYGDRYGAYATLLAQAAPPAAATAKLYDGPGTATDGGLTQKATTAALAPIQDQLATLAARAANIYLRFADGTTAGFVDLDTALANAGPHGGAISAQLNAGALAVASDNRGNWPAFFDAAGTTITVGDGVTLTSLASGIANLLFCNFYLKAGPKGTGVFNLAGTLDQATSAGKASLLQNGQCYVTLNNDANVVVLVNGYYKKLTGAGKYYLYGAVQVDDYSSAPNVVDRRTAAAGGGGTTYTGTGNIVVNGSQISDKLPEVATDLWGKALALNVDAGGALSWMDAALAILPTPDAPLAGSLDVAYRLFYFTLNSDYATSRHEYTTDGGATWQQRKISNAFFFLPATAVGAMQYGLRVAGKANANKPGAICWCPPLAAGDYTAANQPNVQGHASYDDATNGQLGGWCFDENNKQLAVALDVYVDNVYWRPMPTNAYRSDVASAFGCNYYSGFSWQLPSQFRDGKDHNINLLIRGTNQNIGGKTATLNPL